MKDPEPLHNTYKSSETNAYERAFSFFSSTGSTQIDAEINSLYAYNNQNTNK